MVRPNTVLPIGANEQQPDYNYADGVTLQIFELQDGATASAQVPTLAGAAGTIFEVRREGPLVYGQARGAAKPWRVLLRGVSAIQSVAGGAVAEEHALGTLVTPEDGNSEVSVRLA